MNPLPVVIADLKAMRGTALAMIAVVAVALAILMGLSAQERAFRKASAQAADDFPILVGAPGSALQLVLNAVYLEPNALPLLSRPVLDRVRQDPRIAQFAPLAVSDIYRGYPIIGTSANFVDRWGRLTLSEGRVFATDDEAVIGAAVDLKMGDEFEPSHRVERGTAGETSPSEDEHRHHGTEFKIVGRLPMTGTAWDRAILIPIASVWAIHNQESQDVSGKTPAIVIKPRGFAEAYQLRADYGQNGSISVFPGELLVSFFDFSNDIKWLLTVALLANFLVILLLFVSVFLSLAKVREVRYVALQALGASRLYIISVLWLGASGLMLAGAVLAIPLYYGAGILLNEAILLRTGLVLQVGLSWDELKIVALVLTGSFCLLLLVSMIFVRRDPAFNLLRQ